jgi:hypothetical protein
MNAGPCTSIGVVVSSSSAHGPAGKFGLPIYHAETRRQLRAWLEHNHDTAAGVWLCSWRSATGRPRCPVPRGRRGGDLLRLDRLHGGRDCQEQRLRTTYDTVEDLIESDHLATALDANAAARSAWDDFPPSAPKVMLW